MRQPESAFRSIHFVIPSNWWSKHLNLPQQQSRSRYFKHPWVDSKKDENNQIEWITVIRRRFMARPLSLAVTIVSGQAAWTPWPFTAVEMTMLLICILKWTHR